MYNDDWVIGSMKGETNGHFENFTFISSILKRHFLKFLDFYVSRPSLVVYVEVVALCGRSCNTIEKQGNWTRNLILKVNLLLWVGGV